MPLECVENNSRHTLSRRSRTSVGTQGRQGHWEGYVKTKRFSRHWISSTTTVLFIPCHIISILMASRHHHRHLNTIYHSSIKLPIGTHVPFRVRRAKGRRKLRSTSTLSVQSSLVILRRCYADYFILCPGLLILKIYYIATMFRRTKVY